MRDWRRASRAMVRVRRPLGLHVVRRRVRRRRVGAGAHAVPRRGAPGRDRLRRAHREVARRRLHARVGRAGAARRRGVRARAAHARARAAACRCTRDGGRRGDPARRRRLHRPVREPRGAARDAARPHEILAHARPRRVRAATARRSSRPG